MDQTDASATGDHPLFNIIRVAARRSARSRVGLALTDQEDGRTYNRVADVDGRLVLNRITSFGFQLAGSATSSGSGHRRRRRCGRRPHHDGPTAPGGTAPSPG